MDATLTSVANWAEIIGAGSILTGLVFGYFQIIQYRTQQKDAVASNLMQTFYNPVLAEAIALVQTLPDGMTLEELRARGDAYTNAAVTVTTSFETMGLLVYSRIAPFSLVIDLVGGVVSTMNRKLKQIQYDLREESNQPSWGEWFEWLADQSDKVKVASEPAHIKYRDWQPR